jgi:hypothetical protein
MKESLPYLLGRVEGQLGVLKVRVESDRMGSRVLARRREEITAELFEEIFKLLEEIVSRIDDGTRLGDPGTDTYEGESET